MIIEFDGSITNITLSDFKSMESISGSSSFENSFGNIRGTGVYSGVKISEILESSGIDLLPNDLLIIQANDGYKGIYTYENIYPNATWENLQGSLILAYSFNGTDFLQWESGPQIAFLPSDGLYSNNDKSNTSSLEITGSAGSRWISNVISFELKREEDTVTFSHENNYTLSYSQLNFLPKISGSGSYLKTTGAIEGPFNYQGVDIVKTLELIFNTTADFSIEVIATDGYKMMYTKNQVFAKVPLYNDTGVEIGTGSYGVNLSLILAYNENDQPLKNGGPFRMVYVGENAITDGHFWAKYVKTIKINPGIVEWSISLSGILDASIGLDDFDSLVYCNDKIHILNYTYIDTELKDVTYEGFALWIAVSIIDGSEGEIGHYLFNDALVQNGYKATVESGNGSIYIFDGSEIARNNAFILSHVKNGLPLPEEEFPVRLIIPGLSEASWINNVISIELLDFII